MSVDWRNLPHPDRTTRVRKGICPSEPGNVRRGRSWAHEDSTRKHFEISREAGFKRWQANLNPGPSRHDQNSPGSGNVCDDKRGEGWVGARRLAPKEGARIDAPMAPQAALSTLLSLTVTSEWQAGTFDLDASLRTREHAHGAHAAAKGRHQRSPEGRDR